MKSIRFKMALILIPMMIGALLIVRFQFIPRNSQFIQDLYRKTIQSHLETLGDSIVPYLIQNQHGAIHEILDKHLKKDPTWKSISLYDQENRRLYPITDKGERASDEFRYSISLNGRDIAEIFLQIDLKTAIFEHDKVGRGTLMNMMIFFFVNLLFLVFIIDRFLVQRIILLSKNAKKMMGSNTNEKLKIQSPDEIGILVENYESLKEKFLNNQEELINKAKIAENALVTRSRFLANTSHEIRTPLNGIIGMTDILIDDEMNEATRKKLEIVQNSGTMLLSIINDILDFSKIDEKKMVLEFVQCDLVTTLKQVLAVYENITNSKGIYLKFKHPKTIPMLITDPTRVAQVVTNILGNAIKFTRKGGITLELEVSESTSDTAKVRIKCQDTGIGMSQTKIKNLFDPYVQESSSTTRKFGGTGLGLSITKSLVEMLKGTINVSSIKASGTTFIVDLPCKIGDEKRLGTTVTNSKLNFDGSGFRALVAEDNDINRMIIGTHLTKMNFQVEFAENGAIALEKVAEGEFDLILMDMQMPELDGVDCTRQILLMELIKAPKIIALTASAMEEDRKLCLEAGMDGFLSKPFKKSALIVELKRQLN